MPDAIEGFVSWNGIYLSLAVFFIAHPFWNGTEWANWLFHLSSLMFVEETFQLLFTSIKKFIVKFVNVSLVVFIQVVPFRPFAV